MFGLHSLRGGLFTSVLVLCCVGGLWELCESFPAVTRLTVYRRPQVPDSEAETAPDHIRRLIHFASLTAKMQGKSSKREWTEDMSPANARQCRRLGKSPTGDLLEKYDKP